MMKKVLCFMFMNFMLLKFDTSQLQGYIRVSYKLTDSYKLTSVIWVSTPQTWENWTSSSEEIWKSDQE